MKPSYEELEQKLAESQREFRAADATSENLQMQLNTERKAKLALAAENAGLKAFVDALLSIAWQGGSADGAEIQELALKHGLLRQEVYSADEHETLVDDPGNFEDGDPVYFRVETPATDAFLAEVRAQGVEMFGQWLRDSADIFDKNSRHDWAAQNRVSADKAGEFADHLRKGVQS
ncbi:hypothetical protein [Enterobacter kobei]|uniref:hypothetical protein n=1 Tax=Enterobacter kobei TaxID=208224 RepID=UPI00090323B3|nr:hypothetical protein [Enterobacter kobei]